MDAQSVTRAYTVPGTGKLAPGNPGRPRGLKDRRTTEGQIFAGAWLDENLKKILDDIVAGDNLELKFRAAQFFFDHKHGKAPQRIDFNVRGAAEAVAEEQGVPTEPLLALATQIAAQSAAAELQ